MAKEIPHALTPGQAKSWLRKALLSRRAELSNNLRKKYSLRIQKAVQQSPFFTRASVIALYLPLGTEVQTTAIMDAAWRQKKIVLVPKTDRGLHRPYFVPMERNTVLIKTSRGLFEPKGGTPYKGPIGLFLVPGVGFDGHRNRLGFGGGFYDRILRIYRRSASLGLFFEVQSVQAMPCESFDFPLSAIVTEERQIGAQ